MVRLFAAGLGGLCALWISAAPMPADLMGGTELDFAVTTKRAMELAAGTKDKAEIRLAPGGWVDGRFVLSEGQVGLVTLVIKGKSDHWNEFQEIEKTDRRLRAQKVPEYRMTLELDFPAGVELVDVADGQVLKAEKTSAGTHYALAMSADFDMTFSRLKDEFNWWRSMGLLVSSSAKSGAELPGARAWMSWQGERFTNVETFDFAVMPRIAAVDRLKRFYLGCSTGGIYPNFSPDGWDRWTAMLTSFGLNAMQPDFRVEKLKARQIEILRRNGVELLTPIPAGCPVYNGFVIGEGEGRPESDRFVADPETLGKEPAHVRRELGRATCPSAVYERHPYFMEHTVKRMAETFAGYDGIWCNWEPFAFFGRGCFCDRCRGKFAAFAGISEAELLKEWPKVVARGGRLHRQFIRFTSAEHAKMMRVVAEEVGKICGGRDCKAGFIPGVAWCEMASMWRTSDYGKEVRPYDYAKGFKWISPWGPYAIYPTQEPYAYSKWRNLRTFIAARDVRAQVNRDYASAERPKLMAYPHGYQLSNWICYPEALEMNIDSFFFNGWEAVSVYHFPRGYDQRWWAAFARSAAKAAKYEDFVFGGTRIDGEVELVPSAPFAAPNSHEGTATRGLEIKGAPMLQHVAYEKDGRIIVAAFNFWEKGPAFFRVRIRGTDRGEFYCGALRTKVWEFGKGVARGFTDADVAAWKAGAMPALRAAKAADARFEEDFGDREYDLRDMSVGGMACTADVKRERLTFVQGGAEITVDCRKMAVTSWKKGGRETLSDPLAVLSAVRPSADLGNRKWRVTVQRAGKGFVAVTAELKVTDRISKDLALLKMTKTIYVHEGLGRINVVSQLANTSTDEEPRHFEVDMKYSTGGLGSKRIALKGPSGVGADGVFNTCEIRIGGRAEYVMVIDN